jgi:uncharacterized membrane protein
MDAQAAPMLALTIAYWLHMMATVIWIGGLASLALIVLPAAQRSLDAGAYSALLARLQLRVQQVGWFCLAVLGVTGMFQMSSHPAYGGFLAISNNWAIAIFVKHVVIGLMVVVSAYVTWGVLPALRRLAMVRSAGRDVPEQQVRRLEQRENRLLRLNLLLSAIVLLLTALARSVS